MSDKSLVLVDGSSYLYSAFHALPDLRSPAGGGVTDGDSGVDFVRGMILSFYFGESKWGVAVKGR